ncbi:MAG: hypothetical protein ACRCU6_07115 [Fusobacteriaceae bacterium]
MFVNSIPRNISLLIGGIEFNQSLVEISANYGSWDQSQGLLVSTGSITLIQGEKTPEILDPKLNSRFVLGRKINVFIEEELAPICGTHFIENVFYSEGLLQINTVCKLGLLNRVTPSKVGVCVKLDESIQVSTAIELLLNAAGTSSYSISPITPLLLEPIQISQNSSLILEASALALSHGYLLYADSSGIIRNKSFLTPPKIILASSTSQMRAYSQLETDDLPLTRGILNGTIVLREDEENPKDEEIQEEDNIGVEISKTTSYNWDGRIVVTRTIEQNNISGVLIEELQVTEKFEEYNPKPVRNEVAYCVPKLASTKECEEIDEARLKERESVVFSNWGIILSEYITSFNSNPLNGTYTFFGGNRVTKEKITENIEYNLPDPELIEISNGYLSFSKTLNDILTDTTDYYVKYTKTISRMRGAIVPIFGAFANILPLFNEGNQEVCEKEETIWRLNKQKNEWKRTTKYFKCRYYIKPNEIKDKLKDINTYPILSTLGEALELVRLKLDTGKEAPPDFGRLPPKSNFRKIPYEVSYYISDPRETLPLEKSFSLPIYSNTENILLSICKFFTTWEYCRSRIYGISFPLEIFSSNYWQDLAPVFSSISIVENNLNREILYLVDSPTLKITRDSAIISLAGLFYPQNNGGNCYNLGFNVNADCGQSDLEIREGEDIGFDDLFNYLTSTTDDEGNYSYYGPRVFDNNYNFPYSKIDNSPRLGQSVPELSICTPNLPVSELTVVYNEKSSFIIY